MPRAIEKAVILAAGLGNRISAVAAETPKPLLPMDGPGGTTTFLDWHLRALARIGCRSIYLVGNKKTFGTELVAERQIAATTKVSWILNPTDDLSTSGSGHSAWFAFESSHAILDGRARVALMDADIAYDPALLADFADAPGATSKTLVATDYRHTHEEVLVFDDAEHRGMPRVHGKGLLGTKLVDGCECLGEATGVVLFEPEDHPLVREVTQWTIQHGAAKTRSEHEEITQRLMMLGKMSAVRFSDRAFMEVDTPDEYRVLVEALWPQLASLRV